MPHLLALVLAAAVVAACDRAASGDAPRADHGATAPTIGVVDSALPIDTLIARFRATTPDTPTTLAGGASSPRDLTRTFLRAIATQDTATVRRLVLSRAEFAWLYYPHTRFTRPPYELGPELLWLQIGAASEKGIVRVLRRYGGAPLRFDALACSDTATEGPNTILSGCRVTFSLPDSGARSLRLFGSILARDGRYKFVSYANEL